MKRQLSFKWLTDRNCAVDFITTGEWRYPVVRRPATFNDWPLSEQREFNMRFVKLVAAGTCVVATEEDDMATGRTMLETVDERL